MPEGGHVLCLFWFAERTIPDTERFEKASGAGFEDLDEGAGVELVQGQAGALGGFGFSDRPAIDSAQEKIQQALAGCRVIEYLADERGLGCGLDKTR